MLELGVLSPELVLAEAEGLAAHGCPFSDLVADANHYEALEPAWTRARCK